MIFGFDDHDEGIFEQTARFVEESKPSLPTFQILTPYPGTALFRQFQAEGRLLHTDWRRYDHGQVVFRPKLMTPERLYQGWQQARWEAYRLPKIGERVMQGPGKVVHLLYNLLRRGGVDRPQVNAEQ
jgi:radical SAM superfamily enzyme YgiQ (UPF0313 family)